MKKVFTIILGMLFTALLTAQSLHTIDFESSGVGADWDWVVEQDGDNPPLEFVSNISTSGINSSATVAQFTARSSADGGMNWALFYTDDNGEFTFDASNSTVTLMVYKSTISNVGVKFEGLSGSTELQVANTVTDQWEELTFDFSSVEGNTYNRLVIIPDFVTTSRATETILYVDNIVVPEGVVTGPLPEPVLAANAPTHSASDVLSVYSDVYTDVASTDFDPNWGQSTSVTINYDVDGDNTLKYENLNYQGTQFASALNVSSYDYIHIDFWTPNSTGLNFYLISSGPAEMGYALPISTETWVGVDIPLSYFSSVNLADIIQFKVDGNGTVYFDNWYFFKGTPTYVQNTGLKKMGMYPNPMEDVLYVKGIDDGEKVDVYSITGQLVKSTMLKSGSVSVSELNKGVYFIVVDGVSTKVIKK